MSDRIAVIDRGRVQQIDPPKAVYRKPANRFVAEFIGTPPMNMVPGRLADGIFSCAAGSFGLAGAPGGLPEGEILLGCRPETLELVPPESPGAILRGKTDMVEPMGAETFIGVALGGGTRLIARVAPDRAPAVGEAVGLRLGLQTLSFFNPANGERLG